MFESCFWGAALVALLGTAGLVAIGASYQPRIGLLEDDPRILDPRRVFGRKRRWRRVPAVARRLGLSQLR